MSLDPLTYRGALAILGKRNHPLLDTLQTALGGIILASPVLTPIAAVWGWVDQKNEASAILRKLLDYCLDRMNDHDLHNRQQQLAAAHSAIVCESFFSAFKQTVGGEAVDRIRLSQKEAFKVATTEYSTGRNVVDALYRSPIPMPTASCGFESNLSGIEAFYETLSMRLSTFIEGTSDHHSVAQAVQLLNGYRVIRPALQIYEVGFTRLLSDFPELAMLTVLHEHAATRHELTRIESEIKKESESQSEALSNLQKLLLRTIGTVGAASTPHRERLARANKVVLDEPILHTELIDDFQNIVLPSVPEIYAPPRYRRAVYSPGDPISESSWWREQQLHESLGLFLAAYLSSMESTRTPLLILGDPGAGKSLLTRVITARLPSSGYSVVRVQLRQVDAEGEIHEQINKALSRLSTDRLSWASISDESEQQIRVVILDGYDEMLQAAGYNGRQGYLRDVTEFQRNENAQGRPVAVIVTSRIVVADRMRIPQGSTVLLLEPLSDTQVNRWIEVWNDTNHSGISSGAIRRLDPRAVLRHQEIARQPLLLLLLAIHMVRTSSAAEKNSSSVSWLYDQLIGAYLKREVEKFSDLDDRGRAAASRDLRIDLSMAAIGMFNRSAQSISESELELDLSSIVRRHRVSKSSRMIDRSAESIFSKFFFIHVSEVTGLEAKSINRSYEFVHSTFGEYLVADCIWRTLKDLTAIGFAKEFSGSRNDDLLYTLLSHQLLATRKSILIFFREIVDNEPERASIRHLLDELMQQSRYRERSDEYRTYLPQRRDPLRAIAAYTANLTLLRVYSIDDEVEFVSASMHDGETLAADDSRRRQVHLWRAGLDDPAWIALLAALRRNGGSLAARTTQTPEDAVPIAAAELAGDQDLAEKLILGRAVASATTPNQFAHPYQLEQLRSLLVRGILFGNHDIDQDDLKQLLERTQLTNQDHGLLLRYLLMNADVLSGAVATLATASVQEFSENTRQMVAQALMALNPDLIGCWPDIEFDPWWVTGPYGSSDDGSERTRVTDYALTILRLKLTEEKGISQFLNTVGLMLQITPDELQKRTNTRLIRPVVDQPGIETSIRPTEFPDEDDYLEYDGDDWDEDHKLEHDWDDEGPEPDRSLVAREIGGRDSVLDPESFWSWRTASDGDPDGNPSPPDS
jgi:hypothetical protein